jgi:Beta-1,3-glucanase
MRVSLLVFSAIVSLSSLQANQTCGYCHVRPRPIKIVLSPPISPDGSALFSYKNNSEFSDDDIYIQVVGVNPKTGAQCFVSYDSQGNPTYQDVSKSSASTDYSYPLSYFVAQGLNQERSLYLPKLDGARLYSSINHKMTFPVIENDQGVWTICAPNLLNPSDPNNSILWDKTEFAVNDQVIFINPTAVDNFCLPLHVQETSIDGSYQGGGLKIAKTQVSEAALKAFNSASGIWPTLISQKPPVIFSPLFASSCGLIHPQFLKEAGWNTGFEEFFSKQTLLVDLSESFPISLGGGLWEGTVDPSTHVMTFKRHLDDEHPQIDPVTLNLPDNSYEILAGAGPAWGIKNNLQAALSRNLACGIVTNTISLTEPLCQTYFIQNQDKFYQTNSSLPDNIQYIDHYSKVLHSFGDHKIYTFPYDDELNQSGAAVFPTDQFFSGCIELGRITEKSQLPWVFKNI